VVFESNSHLRQIGEWAFFGSGLENLILPSSVEVIEAGAFQCCFSLKLLEFHSDTRLQTIEPFLFHRTALIKFSLPNSIHSISGSAFVECHGAFISFFPSPTLFDLRDNILEDISGRQLIRYFGTSETIEIARSVEGILSSCFRDCEFLERVTFDEGSQLEILEDHAFSGTSLKIIEIPHTAKRLSDFCFGWCRSLVSVTFEAVSQLQQVGIRAFCDCPCERTVRYPSSYLRIRE
jgi:hypothetical protein